MNPRLIPLLFWFVFALPFGSFGQFTLEDSLQLHYTFDSTFNDFSPNGFHGTPNGGVGFGTDRCGNANSAALFDGLNDWIDTDETFDFTERTVSAWFYRNGGNDQVIFTQDANTLINGAFKLTIQSSEILEGSGGGNGSAFGPVTTSPLVGQWHHAVVERNASQTNYFFNGQLVANRPVNSGGAIAVPNIHMLIGVGRSEANRFWNGSIDEVRVYNRTLSTCEIRQLYCAAAPCISPRDTTIYAGTQLILYNNGGPNDTISWQVDGIVSLQHNDSLVETFSTVGVHEVVAYAGDSCCSLTDTILVTVVDTNCNFQASFIASNTISCPGLPIDFTNTSSAPTASTFSWFLDSVLLVSQSTNNSMEFLTAGEYLISLVAMHDVCADTASLKVTVMPSPEDSASVQIICKGDSVLLSVSASSNSTYLWQNTPTIIGDTTPSAIVFPSKTSTYSLTISTPGTCDSIVRFPIEVSFSTVNLSNIQVCDSLVSPSGKYVWKQSGIYADTLQTPFGCDSIIEINLSILNGIDPSCDTQTVSIPDTSVCDLIYPNVITPNSDGINDIFSIYDPCRLNADPSLQIFNRWGQLVWQRDGTQDGWDGYISGELANEGVYFFMYKSGQTSVNGSFTLLTTNR